MGSERSPDSGRPVGWPPNFPHEEQKLFNRGIRVVVRGAGRCRRRDADGARATPGRGSARGWSGTSWTRSATSRPRPAARPDLAGVDCCLIDRAEEGGNYSRAVGTPPRSLEMLRQIGVGERPAEATTTPARSGSSPATATATSPPLGVQHQDPAQGQGRRRHDRAAQQARHRAHRVEGHGRDRVLPLPALPPVNRRMIYRFSRLVDR
ncbi:MULTISPECIES: FAD-dependent monooxygenase [Actinomadura]|uniref:FAD-binding domain-containing protein n=1 Tax=Actinomadura geliboluensis TaxID=882440 RepID=A0A5S4HCB9_9ACTN|nr:hypothetical protein ETD96_00675 [Actinomadura geliboluensis]